MEFKEDFINVLKKYGKLPYQNPIFKLDRVQELQDELSENKMKLD